MQVAVVEGKGFADALFEGEPVVFNRVKVWGVRGQEFLGTASLLNELASFDRLVEASIIVTHNLSGFEDRYSTALDIGLEERGVAVALKHEGREELMLVEGINQTQALGAMARLLSPARFALGAPTVGTGFGVIHAGLSEIH
ncbi:MAG TPA: hypothetical protein VKK81_12455 [Candidatus Binatia bacterium]|nr:hypothetical protein [Candidatus Binatia bacterium]